MTVTDLMVLNGGAASTNQSPEDSATHATSPHYTTTSPLHIVIALAVLLAVFYAFHIFERMIDK